MNQIDNCGKSMRLIELNQCDVGLYGAYEINIILEENESKLAPPPEPPRLTPPLKPNNLPPNPNHICT